MMNSEERRRIEWARVHFKKYSISAVPSTRTMGAECFGCEEGALVVRSQSSAITLAYAGSYLPLWVKFEGKEPVLHLGSESEHLRSLVGVVDSDNLRILITERSWESRMGEEIVLFWTEVDRSNRRSSTYLTMNDLSKRFYSSGNKLSLEEFRELNRGAIVGSNFGV